MALSAGTRLGPYEILAPLGAGGMGEVYRATDTKLGRDVAIKVLPAEMATDAGRLERFQREAHLLAALNHPHIAAIHGLEEADGHPFLVLELVEGEDLKERLARGAIPVDEALEIAVQVAEALEEAHNAGIVHRDLKPANVKVTPDSKVKVLDFGLAKAWAGEAAGGVSPSASMSQSPTLAHSGTQAGVILGTAAYMSPEQARGKPVDKRGDVWAFGVLLWEMLTGRALFAGDTVTDVIAALVTQEPDLDALPAGAPRAVRRLLGRCLKKDPRKRLPDMGAARLELEEVLAGADEEPGTPEAAGDSTEVQRLGRQRAVLALLALAGAAVAAFAIFLHFGRVSERRPAAHFVLDLPDQLSSTTWFNLPVVSPNGHHVVFAGFVSDYSSRRLWIRALSSPGPRELPGTEDADPRPFWSPDGEWIAFVADGELKKLDLAGGTVQRICALPSPRVLGGTWSEEGTIVLATGEAGVTLFSVAATGGEAQALTTLDVSRGENQHSFPWFLPDGNHFLFAVRSSQEESTGLHVASLDAPAERRRLLPGYGRAVYTSGRLLFVRNGVLLAQPFDLRSLQVTGEPAALARDVGHQLTVPGRGFFSASSGVLAYSEMRTQRSSRLEWLDRQGVRLGTVADANVYGQIALAPDEKWIAVEILQGQNVDLWLIDVSRGVPSRFTSSPESDFDPVWSPDSQELVFGSNREGGRRLFRKGRQGQPASLLPRAVGGEGEGAVAAEDWTPDGKTILYRTINGKTVWALPLEEEGDAEVVLELGFVLDEPQISPDGQWLAYNALGTGEWEVYVRPFRRPGETVRVSVDGGGQPKWRGDGKELFYVSPTGELMAVSVQVGATGLEPGLPTVLFEGKVEFSATTDTYAVSADGQRFLVIHPVGEDLGGRIHVLSNWTSLLDQR